MSSDKKNNSVPHPGNSDTSNDSVRRWVPCNESYSDGRIFEVINSMPAPPNPNQGGGKGKREDK